MAAEPATLSFGGGLIENQPMDPRSVHVIAHTPLKYLRGEAIGDLASVEVTRGDDRPDEYLAIIRPNEETAPGDYRFDVLLHAETPDRELLPVVRIPVEMRVLHDIQATPSAVNFGARPVGSSPSETIVIQSHSYTKFDVEWSIDATAGIAVQKTADEDSLKEFLVTQQIVSEGENAGTIEFVLRQPGKEDFRIRVAARSLGIVE
jgi:hypothetical protein